MAFLLSKETMQKLAEADAALADIVVDAIMDRVPMDPTQVTLIASAGLALFQFQQDAVAAGLAESVMERTEHEEEANV